MNIYIRELRSEMKGIFYWILGTSLMLFASMISFPMMTDSGVDMSEFMDAMPRSLMALFGMNDLDVTSTMGYHGILMYYVILAGIIYAAMLGVRILSKEELLKTSEFLLTKPRSRRSILMSKLLAGTTLILVFVLMVYLTSIISLELFGEPVPYHPELFKEIISLLLLMLLFYSFGIMAAAILSKPKTSSNVTLTVVFVTFLLAIFYDLMDSPIILRIVTPFRYFPLADIIEKNTLSVAYILITLLLTIGMGLVSFLSYDKRDMNI